MANNFKIKHDKTKHIVEINTLDETHKKIMNSFQFRRELLPKKRKKLDHLILQLEKLEEKDASQYTNNDIKKRSDLKTKIHDLKNEIHDTENNLSELDYYFKTENLIMDYYEIVDNDDQTLYNGNPELCEAKIITSVDNTDKNDSSNEKLELLNVINKNKRKLKKQTKRRKKGTLLNEKNNILNFFSNDNSCHETDQCNYDSEEDNYLDEEHVSTEIQNVSSSPPSNYAVPPNINEKIENVKTKADLLDQYMMLINNEYLCEKKRSYDSIRKCTNCNCEKTLVPSEGIYVCRECGEVELIIIDSEKPNYKDAVTDTKPGYPYKRSNHLNEWLSCLTIKVYIKSIC